MQSIDDQLRVMHELAANRNLTITQVITESKSAKSPRSRDGFGKLLHLIDSGMVQGILTWNVNRLSRNSIDFGEVQHRLQSGWIKSIETPERSYRTEDSTLLYYVEAGMSNQYVLDLSKAVLRGMKSKIEKGWWPFQAPEGYVNDLENHTIIPDTERLPLVERAFRLLLTGAYTVTEVTRIMNEEWGYRTRRHKRSGGVPLCNSKSHRMFTSIFYTGRMEIKGEILPGSHQAILTLDEFQEVQNAVRRGSNYKKRGYAFNGIMKCVHCHYSVVGSLQKGRLGRSAAIYYACGNNRCPVRKASIREDRLESKITVELNRVAWPAWYKDIILDELRKYYKLEYGAIELVSAQAGQTLANSEKRRSKLLDMKLDGDISSDEFRAKDAELRMEIENLRSQVKSSQGRFDQAYETVNRVCDFIVYGQRTYAMGTPEKKREIMAALGTEYSFDEGTVTIRVNPLLPCNSGILEPQEISSESTEKPTCAKSVSLGWPFASILETFALAIRGDQFPNIQYIV